jgi:sulfate adenylyltransferase subunit 2
MADSPFINRRDDEEVFEGTVRFRTAGDMSCTGAFASTASTVEEIIEEVSTTHITEVPGSKQRQGHNHQFPH